MNNQIQILLIIFIIIFLFKNNKVENFDDHCNSYIKDACEENNCFWDDSSGAQNGFCRSINCSDYTFENLRKSNYHLIRNSNDQVIETDTKNECNGDPLCKWINNRCKVKFGNVIMIQIVIPNQYCEHNILDKKSECKDKKSDFCQSNRECISGNCSADKRCICRNNNDCKEMSKCVKGLCKYPWDI